MKNSLFRHPGLMAISLISAFLVWLVITNTSNPVIQRTISGIPVSVSNASYIESQDLSYRLSDGFDTISVTVRGTRSVVEKLSAAAITANVDLTQIVNFDSDPIMVPVAVSVPGISSDSVMVKPRNVQITLEDVESQDFVINAVTGGTSPTRGYEVGTMTTDPEKLTIRGPLSIVEKIDKVQAEADVSGLTSDAVLDTVLHIYDKNGDELSETNMNYLTMSVGAEAIRASVTLYSVEADIAISAETYGEPLEGYQVGAISVTPSTIALAGSQNALSRFHEDGGSILIDAASQAVDITGASSDVEIRVNLPDYLPSGIRVAEGFSETVVVSVKIMEYDTASIEFETRNITRLHLPESYNAVFADSTIDIRVKGTDTVLANLTAADIKASVDLKDVLVGENVLPVAIELPPGCTLAEDIVTKVTISTITTAETDTAEAVAAADTEG